MASDIAQTAAAAMERTINQFGGQEDAEYIVSRLCGMHRTLNQSLVGRIILPFVQQMAMNYTDGYYDPRNESACKVCRLMWDAVKEEFGITDDSEEVRLPMV